MAASTMRRLLAGGLALGLLCAVGRAHARTGADPKTIKRRFPDPLEKARDRGHALVPALRERSPTR